MKIGYMCGIDFQYEIGPEIEFPLIYSSVKALKKERTCWVQCGIIEVELTVRRWVRKQNFNCKKRAKK